MQPSFESAGLSYRDVIELAGASNAHLNWFEFGRSISTSAHHYCETKSRLFLGGRARVMGRVAPSTPTTKKYLGQATMAVPKPQAAPLCDVLREQSCRRLRLLCWFELSVSQSDWTTKDKAMM